jgi:ketosteroid isomerase-like protein
MKRNDHESTDSTRICTDTNSAIAGQAEDEADIRRLMDGYRDAYIALDAHRVATVFHQPYMFLAPHTADTLATRKEVEDSVQAFLASLKARGYARSDWKKMRVKSFGNGIAIVSSGVVRYRVDGSVLETVGVTYLLRKELTGWKIAVLTPHSPEAVLSLP